MISRRLVEAVRSGPLLARAVGVVWRTAPGYSAAACVLTLVAAVTPAAQAWIMKLLVDQIVHSLRTGQGVALDQRLVVLLGLQMGIWLVATVTSSFVESVWELLSFKVNQHLQCLILKKSAALDLAFFENAAFYNKMENARNEGAWRPAALVQNLLGATQQGLTVAAMTALLFRLNAWLVPLIVVTTLPQVAVTARFSRRRYRLLTQRAPERRMTWYLEQLLSGRDVAHEVRAFDLAPGFLARFSTLSDKFFQENRAVEACRRRSELGSAVVSMAGLGGAYALAAVQATLGRITLGDLAMYFRAAEAARSGLFSFFRQASQVYECGLFLSNLFEFLDLQPGMVEGSLHRAERPMPVASHAGTSSAPRIEFRNVSFRYPDTEAWALKDVSLVIEPEERVALVGPNGGGKSTFLKLLLRLYDPTVGQILINGQNLRSVDPHEWQTRCAVLFQDFVTYQFTVLENVCPPRIDSDLDRPRAEAAVAAVGLAKLVRRLPQAYDTRLGRLFEGGTDISVGEWQRIALARAWYRDASLAILDEPTSALDATAEGEVLDAYRALCRNKTAVLISHRLSATGLADRIVVLDQGSVAECGTQDQLVASGGLYSHMYRLQAGRYTLNTAWQTASLVAEDSRKGRHN